MPMTLKEKLTQARAKIDKGWCQHSYARDADNDKVHADSPFAARWCAAGALCTLPEKERDGKLWFEMTARLDAALPPGFENFVQFNDTSGRTKAEVLALFDRAIAALP